MTLIQKKIILLVMEKYCNWNPLHGALLAFH